MNQAEKWLAVPAVDRTCPTTGKLCLTEDEARAAADRIARTEPVRRGRIKPFRCGFCDCWHTGHLYKDYGRGKGRRVK